MKRKNIVVANWKMNPKTFDEAKIIFNKTRNSSKILKNTDVVVCPPFVYLQSLAKSKLSKNLFLGTQNVSFQEKGAMTGEIGAPMIKDLGAKFVIVGHSERRAIGESNEMIRKKLNLAFDNGITPILCIGEKERDHDGLYLDFIKKEIKECLNGLEKKNLLGLIIAYEPVWAIGKSFRESMNATDVHETVLFIRKSAGELFGKDMADSFKILYGGSVELENVANIMHIGNVSGLLIGHSSISFPEFSEILKLVDVKR